MVDKKLLVILLLLALHTLYIRNLGEQSEQLLQQAAVLEQNIQRENELADRVSMGDAELKRLEASIAFNQSLIFPADEHLSTVTANLQQRIKETAEQCGVALTKLRTGDPEQVDLQPCARLPISFAIRGFPDQTGRFLVQLFQMDKFLRIYTMKLVARRDNKLHLSMSAAAYRFLPSSDTPGEVP